GWERARRGRLLDLPDDEASGIVLRHPGRERRCVQADIEPQAPVADLDVEAIEELEVIVVDLELRLGQTGKVIAVVEVVVGNGGVGDVDREGAAAEVLELEGGRATRRGDGGGGGER